jgi:hypothetical protein
VRSLIGRMAIGLAMLVPLAGAPVHAVAAPLHVETEILVYGGTPSGVTAAVSAARAGADVTLVEPTGRVGGMMASGLSWTDRGSPSVIGGVAREVFDRIQQIEGAEGRYAFPPSTAEAVFEDLLADAGVFVARGERLAEAADAVTMAGSAIIQVRMESGNTYAADMFIDAGYEGDLMARAGVSYRIGREGRGEYDETFAGVRPARHVMTVPPDIDPAFPLATPGPLGSGDTRIQSSNYRVCLSTDPTNQVPIPEPEGYDPARYDIVAHYIAERVARGLTPSKAWVLHVDRLVDDKWDLNQNGPLTFGMPGHNYAYADGSYATRATIEAEQRAYQQGFLYFLTNDERVHEDIREEMQEHGLCADEFQQTENWPHRMYFREGRRMMGRTVVSEHDILAIPSKPDTIGLGTYPLDSHAVSRWMDGQRRMYIEGNLAPPTIRWWSIPYRAITPRESEASNLLVPVAASATHVAYSSARVEPQYMIMGNAAGTAAVLARDRGLPVQRISVAELQARLRTQGAVLTDPGDLAGSAFYTEIEWAYYQGITAGCGDRKFCPSQRLPRDQMASLLARTLRLPVSTRDFFTDDAGNPHQGDINRAAQAGITGGCGANRYCPKATVTRQEMASFLVRALDLRRSSVDRFIDDEDSIHEADINALAASGITAGCSPTRFCPRNSVTRGEVMAFLYRAYDGGSVTSVAALAGPDAAGDRDPSTDDEPDESPTTSPEPTPSPTDDTPAPSSSPEPTPIPTLDPSGEPSASPSPEPTPPPATPTPTPTPAPSATPAPGGGAAPP